MLQRQIQNFPDGSTNRNLCGCLTITEWAAFGVTACISHNNEQMSRTLDDICHTGWRGLYWQRRNFLPLIFAGIQWYQTRPSGCRPLWRLRLIWKLKVHLTLCIITMKLSTRRDVNYGIKQNHKGPFTLSIRINAAMSLAISLWFNCLHFLINLLSLS